MAVPEPMGGLLAYPAFHEESEASLVKSYSDTIFEWCLDFFTGTKGNAIGMHASLQTGGQAHESARKGAEANLCINPVVLHDDPLYSSPKEPFPIEDFPALTLNNLIFEPNDLDGAADNNDGMRFAAISLTVGAHEPIFINNAPQYTLLSLRGEIRKHSQVREVFPKPTVKMKRRSRLKQQARMKKTALLRACEANYAIDPG